MKFGQTLTLSPWKLLKPNQIQRNSVKLGKTWWNSVQLGNRLEKRLKIGHWSHTETPRRTKKPVTDPSSISTRVSRFYRRPSAFREPRVHQRHCPCYLPPVRPRPPSATTATTATTASTTTTPSSMTAAGGGGWWPWSGLVCGLKNQKKTRRKMRKEKKRARLFTRPWLGRHFLTGFRLPSFLMLFLISHFLSLAVLANFYARPDSSTLKKK